MVLATFLDAERLARIALSTLSPQLSTARVHELSELPAILPIPSILSKDMQHIRATFFPLLLVYSPVRAGRSRLSFNVVP